MTYVTYLIAFALLSQLIAKSQCSRMRDALSKNDIPRFLSRLSTLKLSTFILASTIYILFGISVVNSNQLNLTLVYTVNMALVTLYVTSFASLLKTVEVADKEGVYLDYMNHKINACEQVLQAMLITNTVTVLALGLKQVNYIKVKALLTGKKQ